MSVPAIIIQTPSAAREFVSQMLTGKNPTKDYETISIDTEYYRRPWEEVEADGGLATEIYFFQFSNGKVRVCVDGPETSKAEGKEWDCLEPFRPIIESPRVKKVYSTMHADVNTLEEGGYAPRGFFADTEVLDWLYDENRKKHGLKEGAADHCKFFMRSYDDTFGYFPKKKDGTPKKKRVVPSMREIVWGRERYPHIPWSGDEGRKKARTYAALDPYGTWLMYVFLKKELVRQGLWDHYERVERDFGETLRRMEHRGVLIDLTALTEIQRRVHAQLLRIQHVFRELAGDPYFNLKSGKQIADLFVNKLKLPVVKTTTGEPNGPPSFDAAALEIYAEDGIEFAELLLENRSASTLDGTFITGLIGKLRKIVMDEVTKKPKWGIAMTRFKHTGTVTGRISSGDKREGKPNLQNIPAKKEKDPYKLRRFFRAREGKKLIVADYSQIELYILAQFSRDKRMIQAFKRKEDLHMVTAAGNFGIKLPKEPASWDFNHPDNKRWRDECEVWKETHKSARGTAKILNFGIAYGLTAWKLHFDLGIELEDAEQRVQKWADTYPEAWAWLDDQVEFCRDHGFVLTIANRRRRIPEINFRDRSDEKMARKIRGHAENQAKNSPIQGGCGDIVKVAMNLVERDEALHDLGCELLLQVHDELVCEVPEANAAEAAKRVEHLMLLPYGPNDPWGKVFFKDIDIGVGIGVGDNWAEAKK